MDAFAPLKSVAPATTGISIRKENRAAVSRSRPRKRAAVIVIPEREVPGARDRTWASPIQMPSRIVGLSEASALRQAVGEAEQEAKTISWIAIIQGSPRWSSMKPEPRPPKITAGTVPIAIATESRCAGRLHRPRCAPRRRSPRMSATDLAPEVGDRGDQGARVQRDVEGLVELRVVEQERVVLQPGHEDQVAGGGDRQELGQPLHNPQQQSFELDIGGASY